MTSPDAMPAFPMKFDPHASSTWHGLTGDDYERARAAAWEARCRVAVGTLDKIQREFHVLSRGDVVAMALVAIGLIGPLPEEAK